MLERHALLSASCMMSSMRNRMYNDYDNFMWILVLLRLIDTLGRLEYQFGDNNNHI